MTEQFYVTKKGGIHRGDGPGPKDLSQNVNDELVAIEGTKEKGPWFIADVFSDAQIEYWQAKGWIAFMEKKVD